jgi:diguanylate cyclase (GGDEF)-like protein
MGFPGPISSFTLPVVSPLAGLTRAALVRRAWLIFLVVGLGIAVAAGLIADEHAIQPALTVSGLAAVLAILVGIRIQRPARPWPWRLIAGCTLLTTIGIGMVPATGETRLLGQALAGLGYAAGFGGFILLIRGRMPGGERSAFLDAAILAAGTGVVIWAFGFGPLAVTARQSSIATAAFFYPALIATAVVARMWFLGGAHRPATRLIVLLVISSLGIAILGMVRGFIGQDAFAGPYLFAEFASMALAGAAALHPSMAIGSERQRTDPEPVGRRRMVALVGALLVNPATLGIEVALGRTIDPAPYLIGGVLLGLLVIARLGDALRQLGDSFRERESLMALLQHQALYDALTSLPNRNLFNERLAADFASQGPGRVLAVLLVDLDDFKAINDSYGHETGDALLAAVGQRLRSAIREGDTAARLGGDEFVIALPNCPDPLVPVRVGERVLAFLGKPYDIGGHRLIVRASVGVAIAGREDRTADDLVRNADVAMYLAKSRGKGRLEVFEPSMQVSAMTQLQLRADLAVAIAAGDLRLHYQPIVELESGRTIGFEALVRWLRDGRLVPPVEFIPLAESSGLIGPLTDWVVSEACRTVAPWGRLGDRPWVSVNLSSSQLLRQDIVTRLERTLADTGLPAERLVLEITESSLLDIDVARPAIERLSRAGIRLAIDDFGTGYSALSYLARLPIDIVKIDRSFVMALEHAGPEEAIASAIIALAKRLGLTTIGEGIETAAQLAQLSALGCNLGQGYLLGRPAAAEQVAGELGARPMRPRLRSVAGLTA